MKYLLLLLITACGAPDTAKETYPKMVYTDPVPPIEEQRKTVRYNRQEETRTFVSNLDSGPIVTVCFAWDAPTDMTPEAYKFYMNTDLQKLFDSENYRNEDPDPSFLGITSLTTICVENLVAGMQYHAGVNAYYPTLGLSSMTKLTFLAPYVIAKQSLALKIEMPVDGTRPRITFKGPMGVMEANKGFVQWSSDLINWQPLIVNWTYLGGVYSFEMPELGPRAFFRLGFGLGVK